MCLDNVIVEDFEYMGVTFSRTGTFINVEMIGIKRAQKAMFSLLKNIRLKAC